MAKQQLVSLLYLTLLTAFVMNCQSQERKVHVVYMGEKPQGDISVASMHHSMLQSVFGSAKSAKESLIYSYGRSFNGFAARLSDEEAARFSDMEGVVSVLPNTVLKLHTTRSWDFMGFTQTHVGGPQGGDVIIGMLDTGIWPESDSFSDIGFGPPPAKWKGICQTENNFTCNNKIIGARYYNSDTYYEKDIKSPRDSEGHGTHTASTAAGREVKGASYFGLAKGLARGGTPNARIAVYKVCWENGCGLADILAAFDDAIADGVDIISVSLGSVFPLQYFEDPVAIGSFHAMKYGILTSNSAGNSGPWRGWVSNYSPWSLTVAASSIDRKFVSQLVLGNGQIFTGFVINNFELNRTSFPLIWGGDAANFSANYISLDSRSCFPGELDSRKVKGKIVVCESLWDGSGVMMAEGVGIIMPTEYFNDVGFSFPLPTTLIRGDDIEKVLEYIRSTEKPTATILAGETQKDIMAPTVVSFSSRGPNPITPDILKPDLTAPGVDILAAWSPIAPPSSYYEDTRKVKYNIISGTSMSCPHASGAAAYVKATHPNWSPAAIKSALMTTAYVVDPRKHDEREFAYGSGHINPVQAVDPGLVFDASQADYIDFLCKQGYNTTTVRLITGDESVCNSTEPGRAWDLNYPSFSLAIEDGQMIMGIFTRTVTNVGSPNSTYYASIYMPKTLQVKVEPAVLSFSAIGEKKSFTVTVNGPQITQVPIISGYILWKDGVHMVRTPLVVFTYLPATSSSYDSPSKGTKRSVLKGSSMYHKNGILG